MGGRAWRVLFTGRRSGAWNMAADAAVLASLEDPSAPPTLRLYGWDPWCVSLGHFQDPARELDAAALEARGWDFVIRPTGGRAVLHADELTYSILARRDEAPWCATLGESYDHIGRAWSKALRDFGLTLARGTPPSAGRPGGGIGDTEEVLRANPPSRLSIRLPLQAAPPCFASSSRAELAFGERKVVGSAQRRTRDAFVQHGSIPVSADHERLIEVLRLDEAGRAVSLRTLRRHAVSLGEIRAVPQGATRSAWERDLAGSLLEALGVAWYEGELSAGEMAAAGPMEARHRERQRAFLSGPAAAFS